MIHSNCSSGLAHHDFIPPKKNCNKVEFEYPQLPRLHFSSCGCISCSAYSLLVTLMHDEKLQFIHGFGMEMNHSICKKEKKSYMNVQLFS